MKNHNSTIGNLLQNNKLVKLLEILIVFMPGFLMMLFIKPLGQEELFLKMGIIWLSNIAMIALVWLGMRLRGEKWSDMGVTFKRAGFKKGIRVFLLSLLVCLAGIAAFLLGTVVMENFFGVQQPPDMSNYEYFRNNVLMLILTLVGVYIGSSFGEEFVYRAFLINRLSELIPKGHRGNLLAVLVSAVIFGLAHFQWGPTGIVATACMGLVMGLFYLRFRKNLWILVLAHAYMDTVLLVPLFFN